MKMGLTISEWGPSAWNTLHVVAHTYPVNPSDNDRMQTFQFLNLFALHLPCPACREHFQALLARTVSTSDAPAFASRNAMVIFMNDAHNEVNVRLGKRTYSLEEHYQVYRPTRRPSSSTLVSVSPYLLSIGLLVVVLAMATASRCRRRMSIRTIH